MNFCIFWYANFKYFAHLLFFFFPAGFSLSVGISSFSKSESSISNLHTMENMSIILIWLLVAFFYMQIFSVLLTFFPTTLCRLGWCFNWWRFGMWVGRWTCNSIRIINSTWACTCHQRFRWVYHPAGKTFKSSILVVGMRFDLKNVCCPNDICYSSWQVCMIIYIL